MFLQRLAFLGSENRQRYPFSLPHFRAPFALEFSSPIVFFAGDNGSGKSTLLEGLAALSDLPTAGAHDAQHDDYLEGARELAGCLRGSWQTRTRQGFFGRAEDFFGYQKRTDALRAELSAQIASYEKELDENPDDDGVRRALGYILAQRRQLEATLGENADAHSHGEAFFRFFENRVQGRGLYLFDEPEAPLSPLRQLAFLSLVKSATSRGCQFIIASHSPLLLACPGAQIFDFSETPPRETDWEQLDSVRFWQSFFASPGSFLRRI